MGGVLSRELGADAVLDPTDEKALEKIMDLTDGVGVDNAVDCSGAVPAHRLCIDAVRRRGQVAFVGERWGFEWLYLQLAGQTVVLIAMSLTLLLVTRKIAVVANQKETVAGD